MTENNQPKSTEEAALLQDTAQENRARKSCQQQQVAPQVDPQLRAATEDDDGYDPYSDRIELTPLFEEDPWR